MTAIVMRTQTVASGGDGAPASSNWMGRTWKVYANAMEEGGNFLKSIFRLTSATTFWTKYFNLSTPKGVSDLGGFAKQAKNLTSVVALPHSVERVVSSVQNFDIRHPLKSAANVGADICSLANNGCDTAEFVDTIVTPLPKEVMSSVKVVSYLATFLGSLKGTCDTITKLVKNVLGLKKNEADKAANTTSASQYEVVKTKGMQQMVSNILSLASKVSYVALGAIGLASLLTPIGPVAIVTCLTAGTVFGFGSFFYERVVDPYDDRAKKIAENPLFDKAAEIKAKSA